jgi:hypothetical protein
MPLRKGALESTAVRMSGLKSIRTRLIDKSSRASGVNPMLAAATHRRLKATDVAMNGHFKIEELTNQKHKMQKDLAALKAKRKAKGEKIRTSKEAQLEYLIKTKTSIIAHTEIYVKKIRKEHDLFK